MKLKIKKLDNDAVMPKYAHADDACFDLHSISDYEIPPNGRFQIATGIAMQIPENHVGFIWDKSGLSHNHGLKTLGGVIDSGYRGEIKVGIINLGHEVYKISKGNKVAQMIIQEKISIEIVEVNELDDSQRGGSGFGSSGK
jgi:dUTP pyrophosphatase